MAIAAGSNSRKRVSARSIAAAASAWWPRCRRTSAKAFRARASVIGAPQSGPSRSRSPASSASEGMHVLPALSASVSR